MEGENPSPKKESTPKTPEASFESKPSEKIKQEVLSSIKDGTDKEGEKLFNAYKDSLNDSKSSSFAGETYEKAKKSFENIDEEGEANKLVASMDALYRQAGVEEGYKPKIEHEGDLAQNDRQKLIRDRTTEDFQNYPELYAENKISSYVGARVKLKEAEGDAIKLTEGDMVRRVDIRTAVFQVQQARTGLFNVVGEETKKIKQGELEEELVEGIKSGWEFEEKPLDKSLDDLDNNKQNELLEVSAVAYKEEYSSSGEQHTRAVDSLTEEEKKTVFGKVVEADRKIQSKKDNLKEAILNSPDKAMEFASDLRSSQVEKELELASASVAIARKRSELSSKGWKASSEGILNKLIRNRKGVEQETWGQFKNKTQEWFRSKRGEVGKRIGQEIKDAVTDFDERLDKAVDKFEVFAKIDERLVSRVRNVTEKVSSKIQNYNERLRDNEAEVNAEEERRKILVRKTYARSRHNTENYFRKAKTTIGVGFRTRKESAWVWMMGMGGKVIGSEEVKKRTEGRKKAIDRFFSKEYSDRIDKIQSSSNPHMDVFKKDLEERFGFVKKAAESSGESDESGKSNPDTDVGGGGESKKQTETSGGRDEENELGNLLIEELSKKNQRNLENFERNLESYANNEGKTDWEKDLLESGDNLIASLVEVNKRIKLSDEDFANFERNNMDMKQFNKSMKSLLERIDDENDTMKKSDLIGKYSQMLKIKADRVNAYKK